MADNEQTRGPIPPYGPAIWDAAKRGDLHEMEHIADEARHAIARGAKEEGVEIKSAAESGAAHLHDVASHEVGEVREALTHLEQKISELRASHAQKPPDAPQQ
jgi:hypothetical protein